MRVKEIHDKIRDLRIDFEREVRLQRYEEATKIRCFTRELVGKLKIAKMRDYIDKL